MKRWIKVLAQIIPLAIVVVFITQLEPTPKTNQTVTINYAGWSWETTTTASDVAELLVTTFGTYDNLTVDPAPETPITGAMTIQIKDQTPKPLNRTVANNYKTAITPKLVVASQPPLPKTPTPKPAAINSGLATWYRFGDKLTAASRKYPKGTRLKVIAVNSGKSVEVVINDYGPSATTGIDLDLNEPAFAAIAPLGAGKIKIKYYKL